MHDADIVVQMCLWRLMFATYSETTYLVNMKKSGNQ